jgi:hypothetical protein
VTARPFGNKLRQSVGFDFHIGVNAKRGIADGRAWWGVRMPSDDFEIASGAGDFVGVAVAAGLGQSKRAGRNQLIDGAAVTIECQTVALRGGNLQQIAADTNEADGLGGCSAFIGCGQLFEGIGINAKSESSENDYGDNGTHKQIVYALKTSDKLYKRTRCIEEQRRSRIELLGHIFNALQVFTTNCRRWDDRTAVVLHSQPGIWRGWQPKG